MKDITGVDEVAARWHARALTCALSPEEEQRLDAWLAEDARHRLAYADVAAVGYALEQVAPIVAIPQRAMPRWPCAHRVVPAAALPIRGHRCADHRRLRKTLSFGGRDHAAPFARDAGSRGRGVHRREWRRRRRAPEVQSRRSLGSEPLGKRRRRHGRRRHPLGKTLTRIPAVVRCRANRRARSLLAHDFVEELTWNALKNSSRSIDP